MKTPVKLIFAAIFAVMGLFATVQTSSAMPVAPAGAQQGTTLLQDVGWRCGPGWVMNRWGNCVRVRPRVYYAPRAYYAPRYYRPYYGNRYYYGGGRYYHPYYHRW